MRVLVACEFSGVVRSEFNALGHDAWSCDILPTANNSPNHLQCDVLDVLNDGWDLMIAHPPCTYLCSSGLHWNKRVSGRADETEKALAFVQALMDAPIEHIAIENPVGCIGTRIRKADQIIQPYQFGHNASKATCLWLKNLPLLEETRFVKPRIANGKPRWNNQTDSGQNKLGPSADRWALRAETYSGIAIAMATQWSAWIAQLGGGAYPAWIPCPDGCDDFYCTIHQVHTGDCECEGIEWWAERDLDPYSERGNPV